MGLRNFDGIILLLSQPAFINTQANILGISMSLAQSWKNISNCTSALILLKKIYFDPYKI